MRRKAQKLDAFQLWLRGAIEITRCDATTLASDALAAAWWKYIELNKAKPKAKAKRRKMGKKEP